MAKLTPSELAKAHLELKEEARRQVAKRGILQFRADPDTVLAVLDAADKSKMPVGALLRMWVQEKLGDSPKKAPDLVQRVESLERTLATLQRKIATLEKK